MTGRATTMSRKCHPSVSGNLGIRKHRDNGKRCLRAQTLRQRTNLRQRFRGPYQWRRILCLGIILIDFAIIAIASTIYRLSMIVYEPGVAPLMGGVTLSIIIMRIARPAFSLDWICLGALLAGLGLVLAMDPNLSSLPAFVAFSLLLTILSLLMIWIGATTSPVDGRIWVVAAGITGLLCTVVSIIDHVTTPVLYPDIVASVILLLIGMALFGLALSLRQEG